MKYTLENGKVVIVSDREVEKLMNSLKISKEDAIDLWLSDNGYEINEEQQELDEIASKVHINKDIDTKKSTKERKRPEIKVSSEKKSLFNEILTHLQSIYGENVKILNENKLVSVEINDLTFKIDVIQVRKKKS